jgi:acyl carrier protein
MERSDQADSTMALTEQQQRERDLIAVVVDFVRELHPQRSKYIEVLPSSQIERDLGIDSLGRTELVLRIERAFHARLSGEIIGEAETVHDLVRAIERSRPAQEHMPVAAPSVSDLPSVPAATKTRTLVEVLEWHAGHHPDRMHLTVLQDEVTILATLTYGELADRARKIGRGLLARDVAPGDRVALMLPTSIDFFMAFFGILYAGAIPVPIYPPMRLSQLEDHLRRQIGILRNAGACMLITMPEGRRLADLLRAQVESLRAVDCIADIEAAAQAVDLPNTHPSSRNERRCCGSSRMFSAATNRNLWIGSLS